MWKIKSEIYLANEIKCFIFKWLLYTRHKNEQYKDLNKPAFNGDFQIFSSRFDLHAKQNKTNKKQQQQTNKHKNTYSCVSHDITILICQCYQIH